MDTTLVDYAITKLNEAFTKIAPTAVNLGEDFISYTVLKAVLTAALLLGIGLLVLYIAYWGFRAGQAIVSENGKRYGRDEEVSYYFVAAVGGLIALIVLGLSIEAIYKAILAVAYPLMYTLERLVG